MSKFATQQDEDEARSNAQTMVEIANEQGHPVLVVAVGEEHTGMQCCMPMKDLLIAFHVLSEFLPLNDLLKLAIATNVKGLLEGEEELPENVTIN